jgi:hypothetical protein
VWRCNFLCSLTVVYAHKLTSACNINNARTLTRNNTASIVLQESSKAETLRTQLSVKCVHAP